MMIEKIGLPAMLEQAAEEASELAKAALKYARVLFNENPTPVTKDKAFNDLTEEYSDFILCAEELGLQIIPEDASLDFPEDAKQKLLYLAREALKAADGLLLFDILIRSSGKDLFLKNELNKNLTCIAQAANDLDIRYDKDIEWRKQERFRKRWADKETGPDTRYEQQENNKSI